MDFLINYAGHLDIKYANDINLLDLAYTLSVGRTNLPTRIAVVVSDLDELKNKLTRYLQEETRIDGLFEGTVAKNKQPKNITFKTTNRDILQALAKQWVIGNIDNLGTLFAGLDAKRQALPCYPFLREKYWINTENRTEQSTIESLHPQNAAKSTSPYVHNIQTP